jgi:hypothetical protein
MAVGRTPNEVFATICATVDFRPSTMLCVVPIVAVLPPLTICDAAPKYWEVVGALRLVSVPFHSATSCVRRTPSFPTNLLGLNYNEVEVTYTAGVAVAPPAVKVACAQIVKNAQATPAMNVRGSKMDTLQMQYFAGSLVDANVQKILAPYIAQRVG